nr:MAG TPA: Putative head tail adaptor [Bacteriophage sp.]
MEAGAYTQKISIEKLSHSYDSIGNPIEEWKLFKKTYAYMNGLSGKEYWEAATLNAENTVDFVCRWKKFFDVMDTTNYRIVWKGKKFNIKTIDNVQFRNEIVKLRAVHSDE